MQSIFSVKPAPKSSIVVGEANVEQHVIDSAISYLQENLAQTYARYLENINKFRQSDPYRTFTVPSYLSEINADRDNRYYWEKYYYLANKLDPSNPVENLLIILSQRLSNLGYSWNAIDFRFEKGCFNPSVNFWHQDIGDDDHSFISLCFSNVANWSTKILDDDAMKAIGHIPNGEIDSQTLKKMETFATSSKLGVFYNVKKAFHRSPQRIEFYHHVLETDYRVFIRFNKLK